jgi:hypothetical protein
MPATLRLTCESSRITRGFFATFARKRFRVIWPIAGPMNPTAWCHARKTRGPGGM